MTDLTKIDTLFGNLDDATKGALLLAHHRGDVIEFRKEGWLAWGISTKPSFNRYEAYRVYAAPVIGTAKFHGPGPMYHSLHPYKDDQTGYAVSVTFPTSDGNHVPGVYTSDDGLQIVIEVAA